MTNETVYGDAWGVTIAIPAYNYAHFIRDAIASALAQTYPLTEVVVIDDGSTDNTREVVGQFAGSVRYVYQENRGLPGARNAGMREGKYDLFVFLDADDMLEPTMVERCVKVMREQGDDCYVVGTDLQYIDDHGALLEKRAWGDGGLQQFSARDIFLANRFCSMALVRRRALVEVGGFDASLTSSEDLDVWLRIAAVGNVFRLGEELLRVRIHSGNMSKHSRRMFANITRVHAKALAAGIVKRGEPLWWKARSFLYFQTGWMFHDEGQRLAAVFSMLKSLLFWPFFSAKMRDELKNEPILFRLRALRIFLFSGTGGNCIG